MARRSSSLAALELSQCPVVESIHPYDAFLPPALRIGIDGSEDGLRAVVFVSGDAKKGTSRGAQEYESPLLVLTGAEYEVVGFQDLHDRLCNALRDGKPRLTLQIFVPGAPPTLLFDDGSTANARGDRSQG